MDKAAPPTALIDAAKRYAALSGVFDPAQALPGDAMSDPSVAAVVASALASTCDTNPGIGSGWLLRTSERRYILDTLAHDGGLAGAVAERRSSGIDPATEDLLSALAGAGSFAPDAITRTLADETVPRDRIEQIVTALDRAGPAAPAATSLLAARMRLAQIDRQARRRQIAARGFFGRASEKAALLDWFEHSATAPPVQAALLTGLPGIGKSSLIEELVGIAGDRYNGLNVRLDFDRAGLDVLDLRGLTMEVARQLADRIGNADTALLDARLATASTVRGQERFEGSQRALFPAELAAAIGASVQEARRPVLMMLDTLEVLRARGEQHPRLLFDWIDGLVAAGLQPIRIIAAGRGDVLDACPDRRGLTLALDGLDDAAATEMLDRMQVPPAAQAAIINIADGNPLVLRLAANVVEKYGLAKLPKKKLAGDVAAGFLYRFLLSRINDPDLRRLANPGLIARRISAAFLREVLAPQLRMPAMSEARADALFGALAGEHWLVERDPADPDFVRHRADMRAVLLGLLYRDRPAICARIDAAAVSWFGKRLDDASQLDAAYHSLQLMRTRPAAPMISAAVAQRMDAATIDELPDAARDVVDAAAGGRTSAFRGAPSPGPSDAEATQVLMNLIERGDWAEGSYVVEQIEKGNGIDARSPAADAIRAFHWRAGRWHEARQLLAERDRLVGDEGDLTALPPPVAIARLEMRAEFTPRLLGAVLALPGTAGLLDQAIRIPGTIVGQGALAFILAARNQRREPQWSSKEGDAVAAALDLWSGNSERSPATAFAFGVARDRLGARGLQSSDAGWDNPHLLALLSPYSLFAANLATQAGRGPIGNAARDAEARLARAGALFPGANAELAPSASNPIGGIAGLGLFAEWAAAEAMLSGDASLREIGRAAERWRRTLAGDWRYGRPPSGWRTSGPLDATLARRIGLLISTGDPATAALAQLSLWAPGGDGAALLRTLCRRLAGVLAGAHGEPDPLQRAVRLMRGNVPAAFVPALAILDPNTTDRSS